MEKIYQSQSYHPTNKTIKKEYTSDIKITNDDGCKCPPPATKAKCVKVPEVIGRGACQVLVECIIPFPLKYPAIAIKDVMKEVKDLIVHVCKDKVLINGLLHKNINYKTYSGTCELECECNQVNAVYGNLRHVMVEIPFNCFIEIPGAMPGDNYQIEFAGVEESCELDILQDPIPVCESGITAYKKLKEKVIVKIDLKVLRPIQITVRPECNNICP